MLLSLVRLHYKQPTLFHSAPAANHGYLSIDCLYLCSRWLLLQLERMLLRLNRGSNKPSKQQQQDPERGELGVYFMRVRGAGCYSRWIRIWEPASLDTPIKKKGEGGGGLLFYHKWPWHKVHPLLTPREMERHDRATLRPCRAIYCSSGCDNGWV